MLKLSRALLIGTILSAQVHAFPRSQCPMQIAQFEMMTVEDKRNIAQTIKNTCQGLQQYSRISAEVDQILQSARVPEKKEQSVSPTRKETSPGKEEALPKKFQEFAADLQEQNHQIIQAINQQTAWLKKLSAQIAACVKSQGVPSAEQQLQTPPPPPAPTSSGSLPSSGISLPPPFAPSVEKSPVSEAPPPPPIPSVEQPSPSSAQPAHLLESIRLGKELRKVEKPNRPQKGAEGGGASEANLQNVLEKGILALGKSMNPDDDNQDATDLANEEWED